MVTTADLASIPLFGALDDAQTSTSPVRLLVMFGTEFRQLEAAHPEIASRLGEAMQARLTAAPR